MIVFLIIDFFLKYSYYDLVDFYKSVTSWEILFIET